MDFDLVFYIEAMLFVYTLTIRIADHEREREKKERRKQIRGINKVFNQIKALYNKDGNKFHRKIVLFK